MSSQSLAILVTGEPVDSARRTRGDFVQLIQRTVGDAWRGAWHVVDLRREDELPDSATLAGVIITGSASFLQEGAPWMVRGVAYLARLVAVDVPTFGICFGHQMLGRALGGRVDRNPLGREIGTVPLWSRKLWNRSETSTVIGASSLGGSAPPSAAMWVQTTHLDSVVTLPANAAVLAWTELEPNAFVRFSTRAWGVQFHPEMDAAVMRCYISERLRTLRAEGREPEQLLEQVTETPESAAMLRDFALGCAGQHRFELWGD